MAKLRAALASGVRNVKAGGDLLARPVALLLAGLLFACLAAGDAGAQNRDPNRPIALHDADGDGRISPEEWPRQNFIRIDKDNDGFLTSEDFARHWGVPLPRPGGGGKGVTSEGNGTAIGQHRSGELRESPIQWIDTHVHTTGGGQNSSAAFKETVREARAAIGDGGLAIAILMPTPQLHATKNGYFTLEGFVREAKKHPDRFALLGGGGSLNPMINRESPDGTVSNSLRRRFEKRAEEILAMGAVGFGEMTALHFSLADHHPFESVPADHPLFLLLADIAARHDVPIDLHIEPVLHDIDLPDYLREHDNPKRIGRNIDAFERFLDHNRGARIVWAHAGTALLPQRTPELTEELMARHPNLYLQVGVLPGKVPELRILGRNGINPRWMRLLERYPDRIVLGGDQFYSPPGNKGPAAEFAQAAPRIRARFARLLSDLPAELARKIGYENAIRIYRLNP